MRNLILYRRSVIKGTRIIWNKRYDLLQVQRMSLVIEYQKTTLLLWAMIWFCKTSWSSKIFNDNDRYFEDWKEQLSSKFLLFLKKKLFWSLVKTLNSEWFLCYQSCVVSGVTTKFLSEEECDVCTWRAVSPGHPCVLTPTSNSVSTAVIRATDIQRTTLSVEIINID